MKIRTVLIVMEIYIVFKMTDFHQLRFKGFGKRKKIVQTI